MRLFLIPLSTRRTFLYAQRLDSIPGTQQSHAQETPSYADRGAAWAARKWSEWEGKEAGWQRKVVDYGNRAFRRIPYQEWGLKSVPPLVTSRREAVEVLFPKSVLAERQVVDELGKLGVEREGLHRKKMIWCFVGMPVTLPFALVPIVPNLPFFYLVYRAWSHWRAISGGKHIQWLVHKKLLQPKPSPVLDALYAQTIKVAANSKAASKDELLLLSKSQVRTLSEELDVPALEMELERAVWQVQQAQAQAKSETPDRK